MIPLVDMHCHLLAGLDDGPGTEEDALTMCRMAWANGTHVVAALAHQNERWRHVTPERIRQGTQRLAGRLREAVIPLTVIPSAEVQVQPDIESAWRNGELLSVADRGQYLLIEMPHGAFVNLEEITGELCTVGVRPILAHPERQPELLYDLDLMEQLIRAGCLIQVSAASITSPPNR
jgi:protein-tyrosine phosphatase